MCAQPAPPNPGQSILFGQSWPGIHKWKIPKGSTGPHWALTAQKVTALCCFKDLSASFCYEQHKTALEFTALRHKPHSGLLQPLPQRLPWGTSPGTLYPDYQSGRNDTHFVLPAMDTFSFQQGSLHKVGFGFVLCYFIIPGADMTFCNHFQVAEGNFEIKSSNIFC